VRRPAQRPDDGCIQTDRTILALDFSPDGRFLASGGWQHVALWDAMTGKCVDLKQTLFMFALTLRRRFATGPGSVTLPNETGLRFGSAV
jgi:WD40 repeat protein